MALVLPNVSVCQALKDKIKSVIGRNSQQVVERFHDTVLYHPKLLNMKMYKAKSKKEMEWTKGR